MGVSKIGHRLAIKSIIDDLRGVSLDNSGRYDATNPVPLKFNYRRIMIEPAAGEKFDSWLDFRWLGNDLAVG